MHEKTFEGFHHQMTDVGGGVRLHSVMGGSGSPVVLLHGFPQTWHEWRHIMVPLAREHTVVAVDLKGGGQSDKPATGYDKTTMAGELERLRKSLGMGPISLVGHDIGGMTAYAWAAAFPASIDRLAIIDVPIPGASLWESTFSDPMTWHFPFHNKRDLPELLIRGNEYEYADAIIRERIFNQDGITHEDVLVSARAMAQPGGVRGMLEWYRAFPQDAVDNRRSREIPLPMPVLAIGGDKRWGARMGPMLEEFASDVTSVVIADCGHWVPEERPQELLAVLREFLGHK